MFKCVLFIAIMSISREIAFMWRPQDLTSGVCNGLVQSGNKPLYELVLTKILQ